MAIRILLADGYPESIEAAVRFLPSDPGCRDSGARALGSGYIGTGAPAHPDSVRMDLAMPEINGLEATRRIKAFAGAPRVIILTLYDNPEYRTTAAAAGADGFIAKSEFTSQLLPLLYALFTNPVQAGTETCPSPPTSNEGLPN